jgi:hypothetical protein
MVTKQRREPTASKKRRAKPDLSNMPDFAYWEGLVALGKTVPRSERAKRPTDLARNFDHYLDGSPRQD